jgi:signal peptidase I
VWLVYLEKQSILNSNHDGELLVDGMVSAKPPSLNAVKYEMPTTNAFMLPFSVPSDNVLVLGDNPSNAYDGGYWGALPMRNVIGRPAKK